MSSECSDFGRNLAISSSKLTREAKKTKTTTDKERISHRRDRCFLKKSYMPQKNLAKISVIVKY